MKRYLVAAAMLSMALGASGHAFSQSASTVEDLSIRAVHAPPMLGIHWARGFEPNFRAKEAGHFRPRRPPSSPNMTYHGGKIMPAAVPRVSSGGRVGVLTAATKSQVWITGTPAFPSPIMQRPRMSIPAPTVRSARRPPSWTT
jgi:hypothetical protein